MTNTIKIKSSFEITHNHIHKSIPCMIDIAQNDKQYIEYLTNYQLCAGNLEIDGMLIDNALITFIQPQNNLGNTIDYNTNNYTDGINGVKNWHWNNTFEIHNNNIIKDKVTSINGHYVSFITNGIYDIKIQYNGKVEVLKNQEIVDGLIDEYYYIIDGQIKQKLQSTYIMHDDYARNINLKYFNQYGHLINGEIIISQNNNLIVYRKINENNMFALEPGIYDIRLRGDNINTIIITNFEFLNDMDFVKEILNYMNNNDILYINEEENINIPQDNNIRNDEEEI